MATLKNGVQYALATTAVLVLPESSSRRGAVFNAVTGTTYIGAAGVTSTTGIPLEQGATLAFAGISCPNNAVYAISLLPATVFVTEINLL